MAQRRISTECILERTKGCAVPKGRSSRISPVYQSFCHQEISSSSSDDEFEKFLSRMKTPKSATCCTPRTENKSLNRSKENLFSNFTSKKVFSDSDDDDDDDSVFGEYAPRTTSQSIQVDWRKGNERNVLSPSSQDKTIASRDRPNSSQSVEEKGSTQECTQGKTQQPRPSVVFGCDSSDDEIDSLIVRVKQRMVFPATKSTDVQNSTTGRRGFKSSCENTQTAVKSENAPQRLLRSPVRPQSLKSQVLSDAIQVPGMPVRWVLATVFL